MTGVYGEAGLSSTVGDLLIWARAVGLCKQASPCHDHLMEAESLTAESQRLAMLQSLGLVPGQRDPSLQVLAALAANISESAVGLVSLVERSCIYVVGGAGFDSDFIDPADSFCSHAVLNPASVSWVSDALADPQFRNSRYVTGEPYIRFYAGVPLTVNGQTVGTLSVLDPRPRVCDPRLVSRLKLLAEACEAELTERHRTAAMRQALAASADALIDCDVAGRIVGWSVGAERLFGFPAEEALGANVTIIVPPDQQEAHRQGVRRWQESGAARLGRRIELPAKRRDGSDLDIELWMSVTHECGAPRIHANIRDISARRAQARNIERAEARSRELKAQLNQVWRLNSLGEMAATLSHELNQPLGAATTYIHACQRVLQRADPISASVSQTLDLAKAQLLRAGSIIRRMRQLLSHDSRDLQVERVSEMVGDLNGILSLIQSDAGVALEIIIDETNDHVRAERIQFQQAVVNLVRNAAEALTGRTDGIIRVVGRAISDTIFELSVSDNGPGVAPDQIETIFRPLMTTKTSGMGLGLSVTRTIVERHGGSLDVTFSDLGGAAFTFCVSRECETHA